MGVELTEMEPDGFYQTNYSPYDDGDGSQQQQQPPQHNQQQYYQPNNTIHTPSFSEQQSNNGAFMKSSGSAPDLYAGGFDDEPPLLEELGINFDHILQKTKLVLNPLRSIDSQIVNETDLTGPLIFAFALATTLLFSGKVHFGYIYGISIFSIILMWCLLVLMSPAEGPGWGTVASILGYCLLPIVLLSAPALIFSLQSSFGLCLTIAAVLWCSVSSSKLFCSALKMESQQAL